MAQMTVGMAWGVPVQITELGAHLQAYVEMQPTIAAIRLCNRLGQGPAAYITKLPVELVYMVEEMLMHDVRRRAECTWEESFECFEDRCRPIDHLQQDYHKDMYYRITDGVDMEDDRHLDVLDQMGEMLGETSEHLDEHFSRKSAWRHRVCQHGRPNHQGAFSQYDKVLREHFGLEAYIAHHKLDKVTVQYEDQLAYTYRGPSTTVSYLILPASFGREDVTADDDLFNEEGVFEAQTNHSMLVDLSSLKLTKSHARRFSRAMKLLAFTPKIHSSQLGTTISAYSPENSLKYLDAHSAEQEDTTHKMKLIETKCKGMSTRLT